MALMNRKLYPAFEVVYLMPDERYTYVSSSLVKEIARLKGKIDELVPPEVAKAIRGKIKP
jgi:pantetheine-phosphate adenylyltransferase